MDGNGRYVVAQANATARLAIWPAEEALIAALRDAPTGALPRYGALVNITGPYTRSAARTARRERSAALAHAQ